MRLAALLATFVVLFGIARSGARYFYCPMMGATMEDACCPSSHDEHERSDGPVVEAPDCCKAKRLGALPAAAAPTTERVDAAPLAAVLPSEPRAIAAAPPRIESRCAHEARAGPESPARRRSSLMIWNC